MESRLFENQQNELNKCVSRQLLQFSYEDLAGGVAMALHSGDGIVFQTRQVAVQLPFGQGDSAANKPEPWALSSGVPAETVRTYGGRNLGLQRLEVATETPSPLSRFRQLTKRNGARCAIRRPQHQRNGVRHVFAAEVIDGDVIKRIGPHFEHDGMRSVGTVFGLKALGDKSDFNDVPTTDRANDAERNALISNMAFGVAVILGVTDTVLLLSKGTKTDEQAANDARNNKTMQHTPFVGPTGGGAAASWRF